MNKVFIIGISGGTGSGKTTLAKNLKDAFQDDVLFLAQDYYYKSHDDLNFDQRTQLNYDHPSNFDNDLLIAQLQALKEGKSIQRPVYSFVKYKREEETILEPPKKVIILEGILIFTNEELMNLMDMKIFVDTDADIRFARRLMRDIKDRGRDLDSVVGQYLSTVKPMHDAFIEPSKKNADIIIPEGGMNKVALSMLIEKIKNLLEEN